MYAETIEKKRKRTRRTFFFLFALEVLNSTFFFHRARVKKKSGKKRRIVFNSSNTILSLYVLYVCACSSSSPSVLFFSVYIRAFGVCKHTSMRGKEEKKLYEAENEWKTHELFYVRSLNIDRSEGREREKEEGKQLSEKIFSQKEKEKQSRLEMCVDGEYVQKKMHTCIYTQQQPSSLILFS